MNLNRREKLFYLAAIPLAAGATGSVAAYWLANTEPHPVIIPPEAIQQAKDGKLTVEVVTRDETESVWPIVFLPLGVLLGLAAVYYAILSSQKE